MTEGALVMALKVLFSLLVNTPSLEPWTGDLYSVWPLISDRVARYNALHAADVVIQPTPPPMATSAVVSEHELT